MILRKGDSELEISPKGGTVVSWRVGDSNVIYKERKELVNNKPKRRGGIPICSPFFGPDPGIFKGDIPQHGWLRDTYLKTIKRDDDKLLCGTEYSPDSYSWELSSSVSAMMIKEDLLQLSLILKRGSDGISSGAPVCPAFHPYFICAAGAEVENGTEIVKIDGQGRFDTKIFPVNPDLKIKVNLFGMGIVKITLGDDFINSDPHLAIWSDQKEKYLCVEPIFSNPDLIGTKEGKYLKEGEELRITCDFVFCH